MQEAIGLDTIMEGTEKKISKEKFKKALEFLLNSFTDVIPTQIVDSTTPINAEKKGYKVRKGWFLQVDLLLQLAELDMLIPPNLLDSYNTFLHHTTSQEFIVSMTKKEDIDLGNKLIRDLIASIE